MLSLIAKLNCKPMPNGRLVNAEEKELLLERRNQSLRPSEDTSELPNIENNELTIVLSDNESDSELLLDEQMHRRTWITTKLVTYYHWILILFKNGWWRTTLLLWFIWWGGVQTKTWIGLENMDCFQYVLLPSNSTKRNKVLKHMIAKLNWTNIKDCT